MLKKIQGISKEMIRSDLYVNEEHKKSLKHFLFKTFLLVARTGVEPVTSGL
jgi:hypothetical protein